ncbi:hypothetical protein H0H81_009860 [Sphagnurus paluster]|uniref:Uncharacterized protein n=1 Tax=Sphagnurus paluster TaxID=117069 RepID=A0A9P7FP81_9AGAR|nr:hypothetical protein H0H81_009860 [Sphagnurus paluster]
MLLGDLLATWFSRAINTNKLSLSLTTHDDSLQKEAKIHLLEKILEFLPHFSELSLKDRGYIVVSPLLEAPPGRLMMLERLCLDFNRIPDRAKFPASATVFKDAPNLKDVQLQVPSSTLNHNSRFSLPWIQLTRLIIDVEMTLPDFCNVIFQSTAIRTALFTYINLRNDGDLPDGWTPPSPCLTAFPQLTDLVLEFHAWSYIGSSIDYQTIIQNLYLPKIEKLCLAGNIIGLGLSQPPLPRIDPGTLRILSLLEVNVDIATLTELVRVSPLIEELTLCLSRVSAAQLLNALAADDMASRGQTFERLKEFRFAYCPDESHTLEDYTAVGMAFSALVKRWIVDQSALLHAVLVVYEPKARHKMLDIAHGLGEIAREYGRTDFRAEMKVVRDGPNLRRALELYYVLRGPKY